MDEIINLIKKYGPLSYDSIRNFTHLDDSILSKVIGDMEDNQIYKIGKKYNLIDNDHLVKGTIVMKSNRPYLRANEKSYFVPQIFMDKLFDKDEVIAEIVIDFKGREEAHILKNLGHTVSSLVAQATKKIYHGNYVYKILDPNSNYDEIEVPFNKCNGAVNGDYVLLNLAYNKSSLYGCVDHIIGHKNDVGADILALVEAAHVPYEFSSKVYEQIKDYPSLVNPKDLKNRCDYTKKNIITIDGVTAKDLDDAISLEILDNGNYELGVYIADVSHYVEENTPLDLEALDRGTSIYLADRVIPMLPEKLSNGLCSLNEGVIRLCLACIMEINPQGNLVSSTIEQGYIKSKYRMDYDTVNDIFKGIYEFDDYDDVKDMLFKMLELSLILRKKRTLRGAIEFDTTESEFIINEKGKVIGVVPRTRDKAEMMIEDFMLEANETVAETLNRLDYPCCYRVHENPSEEKMEALKPILQSVGIKLKSTKEIKPITIQKILDDIKDTDKAMALNTLILRSMAKAKYDPRSLGHYGLAATYYCHFTSPIRRYPDLETHRIIHKLLLDGTDFNNRLEHFNSVLPYVCERSSVCERKAIDLERQVDDMKIAEYMEQEINKSFIGIITSVTSFGLFIMLDNTVEGLCHIKNMPDYYDFDPKAYTLTGEFSKEVYNIGDKVKIRVIGANKLTRQVDFLIEKHYKKGA